MSTACNFSSDTKRTRVVTAGLGLVFLRETLTLRKGFGLAFAISALICYARS